MTHDSILFKQSKKDGSSTTFSEAKTTKLCRGSGRKYPPSRAENDSKKQGNSPLPKTRPSEHPSSSESTAENGSLINASDELEFEIEKARLEIHNHFMNMEIQMYNNDKVMAKELEIWTLGGLANIHGGKNPQNEFIIRSLIDNFEEIIGNIERESKSEASHTMDGICKILVKLIIRIEQSFRPKPRIETVRKPKRDSVIYLWIGLWSLFAILVAVFPDYLLKIFESAVASFQSTILIFVLFCMLYFLKPVCK